MSSKSKSIILVSIGVLIVVVLSVLAVILWQNDQVKNSSTGEEIVPADKKQDCSAILDEFSRKAKNDPLLELTAPVAACMEKE